MQTRRAFIIFMEATKRDVEVEAKLILNFKLNVSTFVMVSLGNS